MNNKKCWIVMKASAWDCIEVYGCKMSAPHNGPQRFIPVFDTREQALEWAGGDETHVVEAEIGVKS